MLTEKTGRAPRRVRNELRFRPVEVIAKTFIANSFYRIEFGGEALAGFTSAGFDDHVKVFFPDPATGELYLPQVTEEGIVWKDGIRPLSRDYTPLSFNPQTNRLTIDFYQHKAGVASDWATTAHPGDRLAIGGPRGSLIVPEDYAFQLYVCDETGLPAFKRRMASLGDRPVRLYAFVNEAQGKAYLGDLPNVDISWLGSGALQADVNRLISGLEDLTLPAEEYFIWLTGEGAAVKQLSDYFTGRRKLNADFVRAVAYWHEK
ncbi:MAG TPA: NADPH-dependent ferric siderophore reductase [Erwinia sp.]|uniref:siderophore-interacting protein n=1 Tax=Erwinia citreus TaxID=558 RepID=UPI000E9AC23F|nr:siderophore-interacting protein [Erwinia sp.]HBV40036.1 NADPH-dependent ferric siderophore reductase [Erwinia sp.]